MTDDQVVLELERTDDALRVIGKIGKAIAVIGGIGMPPAAVVEGDRSMSVVESIDHLAPSPSRAAPVVEKHENGLTRAPILDIDLDAIGRDLHGHHPTLRCLEQQA
jgi:hypothetical protein